MTFQWSDREFHLCRQDQQVGSLLLSNLRTQLSQRMNRLSAFTETLVSRGDSSHATDISTITLGAAVVCTVWYAAVSLVCAVGYTQL